MNAAAFGLILLVERDGRFDESVAGLGGLARRAPLAAAGVLVVLLSLTGIPPTAGFMGKYFLFAAAVDKGLILLAAAGALNSAISLFYYFRIGRAMFLEDAAPPGPERISRAVTVVLAVSAAVAAPLGDPARSPDRACRPGRPWRLSPPDSAFPRAARVFADFA